MIRDTHRHRIRKEVRDIQVVLLEDAKTLGKKGQIVNVNNGCARSFILPRKLRVEANSKNLSDLKLKKANDNRIAAEQLAATKELGVKLDESPVILTIKAGESGRAFGSVSSKETGKVTGDQLGIDVNKKKIMLNDPTKSIGSFEAPAKFHKEVTAGLAVKVVEA